MNFNQHFLCDIIVEGMRSWWFRYILKNSQKIIGHKFVRNIHLFHRHSLIITDDSLSATSIHFSGTKYSTIQINNKTKSCGIFKFCLFCGIRYSLLYEYRIKPRPLYLYTYIQICIFHIARNYTYTAWSKSKTKN